MRRYGRIARDVLICLAVAAALSFGGSVAMATARASAMTECSGPSHGACTSDAHCQSICDAIFGVGQSVGDCRGVPPQQCCWCLF